ncbi:MAG: hypothetical protein D6708_02835 [Candidatus Dadabacteria bacterium]|nr:MAG: hypothetical protein D6708_02835 [Candidatus Dadabacteria bacterium]
MDAGLITETQLQAALSSQKTWGGKLGSTLVRMGFVKEEDILRCLSAQLRLPAVDFRKVRISPRALAAVPLRIAEKYHVIPVALKEESGKKSVILAMADPTNLDAISEIEFQTGVNVRPVVATESGITRAINYYYRKQGPDPAAGGGPPRPSPVTATPAPPAPEPEEEMVILQKGEERRVGSLDGLDARDLLEVLLRVLEKKGVVTREELLAALRSE